MFSEETNYIHVETLKSRKAADYLSAYSTGINFWKAHGVDPQFNRMGNETSAALEAYCAQSSPPIKIEFVPPGMHRANKAERAIRTWKDHFIAGLATTDPEFPMAAWDHLVPQVILFLNLR
jgi:hypothetical protein